ncbi:MAG: type II toxin-antitoxin system PemK/MazF family toxin [Nocardioidaceae bacterium]
MPDSLSARLLRLVSRTARERLARTTRRGSTGRRPPTGSTGPTSRPGAHPAGPVTISYSPRTDGRPDPGEVVWAWVPYEEDASRGKDRPILIIGRREGARRQLVGLMLTSKDHDRDAAREAGHGRYWMDIGTGGWDAQRRPSEVRLDRLLEVDTRDVRREGAALDRAVFDRVVTAARSHHD